MFDTGERKGVIRRVIHSTRYGVKFDSGRSFKLLDKQLDEIKKCAVDPVYFLINYAYIKHPTRGTIRFNLYPNQIKLIRSLQKDRKIVVNKARQIGISTVVAGFITWMIWFHKDQEILVVATKKKVAANIVKKIKTIIRHIPLYMKRMTMLSVDNVFSLELTNGSKIEAIPRTVDAGRSEGLTLLFVDEAAHIESFEEVWTSLKPVISTGGKLIVASTPKGVNNGFFEICKAAKNCSKEGEPGENGFVYFELPWISNPEFNEEWFERETKGLSKRAIRQEYLCSFVGSGDTVLEAETLDNISKDVLSNTNYTKDEVYPLICIHRKYDPSKAYLLTGDTARGDSGDYTGLQIWEVVSKDECHEAATYKEKITYDKAADIAERLYKLYNCPLVAIETNFMGIVVIGELFKRGCGNIYYSVITDKVKENSKESNEEQLKRVPGFTTSSKTRDIAISVWERMLREGKMHIYSSLTYDECATFIWKKTAMNTRPEAQAGNNDDLVISSAIASYLITMEYDKLLSGIKDLSMLYDNIKFTNTNVVDFLTKPVNDFKDSKEKNIMTLEQLESRFSDVAGAFTNSGTGNNGIGVRRMVDQYKIQKQLMDVFPEMYDFNK